MAVLGAGVAGLTAAYEFVRAGFPVTLHERNPEAGQGCSRYAGGMIAPWCEAEAYGADATTTGEPALVGLGRVALDYWRDVVPVALANGSLLVAPVRDTGELARFGRRTANFATLDAAAIAELEPDLACRFARALYFAEEAHLEPRAAVAELLARLRDSPLATLCFNSDGNADTADWLIDCRGHAARDRLPDLRGVKGEMVVLFTRDITLSRPVQLLQPRTPAYIVPRGDGRFMVGATSIENEERGRVRARALLDLLGAAYTVHPAFGEAEVVEIGCDLRPAFPDNMPAVRREGRRIFINGLYRHGFLLAPALAQQAVRIVLADQKASHADQRQRRSA